MKTSRTHRTPKAEATERASEAAAILREETQAMDDTARERAHQAAREAASEAKAKREIARKHQLKVEVNEIIDTRERALRVIYDVFASLQRTILAEDDILNVVEHFGVSIDDARLVIEYNGDRWDIFEGDEGRKLIRKKY